MTHLQHTLHHGERATGAQSWSADMSFIADCLAQAVELTTAVVAALFLGCVVLLLALMLATPCGCAP